MEEENKNVEENVTPVEPVQAEPAMPAPEPVQAEPATPAPEPAKKKGKGGLILILLILVIGGGFAAWYFAFGGKDVLAGKKEEPKQEEKKEEKKEEEKKEETKEESKKEEEKKEETKEESKTAKVDVDSAEVKNAMWAFKMLQISEDIFTKDEAYSKTEYDSIDIARTLGSIVGEKDNSLIAYCGGDWNKSISIDKANEYLNMAIDFKLTKDYFVQNGKQGSYKKNNTEKVDGYKIGGSLGVPTVYAVYLVDDSIYVTSASCDGQGVDNSVRNKLISAEKDGNILYVYEKRAFYDKKETGEINENGRVVKFSYYKDYAKTELIEEKDGLAKSVISGAIYSQPEELTWDKYNTYKYTFKIKDGNYYFQKYELVK